ncbi:hypothetical protein TELCIR_00165 [Teladorsagia circumcincta]|uniref:Uncharacterized protein n=1 Tax=Teladorsagia circumcincta TaxID=45464 RepID=A0A2G9V7F9_TELCI|nr:hypothetical protein TELCIR_00165 [Teladorsagia circumcincta]
MVLISLVPYGYHVPTRLHAVAVLISNWTQKASDYAVDERAGDDADDHCRVFEESTVEVIVVVYRSIKVNNARTWCALTVNNELFTRDISGTVFSLVMIIVLVVSMYLLMKHRMQVQSRFTASRRDEMARAAAIYGITRRGDVIAPEDLRIAPFVAAGIDGPPPYVLHTYASRMRNDILPPLPSYEDATKDAPIRLSPAVEPSVPIRVTVQPMGPSSSSTDPQMWDPLSRPEVPGEDDVTHETPIISRVVSSRRSL